MLTQIEKLRLEVADTDVTLPILSDDEYAYFLEKNSDNISRAALDAARTILLKLSQRTDDQVDIFSIKGSKAASEYRLALQLFLTNPNLNPVLQNCQGYFGGVSISDMQANGANSDNNIVTNPYTEYKQTLPFDFFKV